MISLSLVRLWTMNSYTNRVSYVGHNYPVWHVDLSNIDVYFVSASMDQTARLWNLEYNYPLRIFAGHTASVDVSSHHFCCGSFAVNPFKLNGNFTSRQQSFTRIART
jgi:WD40 repeat protein